MLLTDKQRTPVEAPHSCLQRRPLDSSLICSQPIWRTRNPAMGLVCVTEGCLCLALLRLWQGCFQGEMRRLCNLRSKSAIFFCLLVLIPAISSPSGRFFQLFLILPNDISVAFCQQITSVGTLCSCHCQSCCNCLPSSVMFS